MKKNIAIIGAGQLGSRHLQSLADLDGQNFEVFVYDTFQQSLDIATQRYEECRKDHSPKVNYLKEFNLFPKEVLLTIVATGSLPRREIIEKLLQHSKVEFLILEKFLFPKLEDYEFVEKLLVEKQTKAFVNTPRRMFDYYKGIKSKLSYPFHMELTGVNWGMGCNSIHFLDLFYFLSNSAEIEVINNLDAEILDSKRKGYVEFTGSVFIKDELNNTLLLSSFKDGTRSSVISICDRNRKMNIHEAVLSKIISFEKIDDQLQYIEEPISLPKQSERTSKIVNQLVELQSCELTTFKESSYLHIKLLELFLDHYNKVTKQKTNLCQIT